jgi:hypothetical protein
MPGSGDGRDACPNAEKIGSANKKAIRARKNLKWLILSRVTLIAAAKSTFGW